MKKSFKSLDLNKKTIAKLNNDQLNAVKGGNRNADTIVVHCNGSGATVIKTKVQ